MPNDERDFFIDEQLKYEIIAQLPHLKKCNFKDAKFWNEDWTELRRWNDKCDHKHPCNYYGNYLNIMGAVLE